MSIEQAVAAAFAPLVEALNRNTAALEKAAGATGATSTGTTKKETTKKETKEEAPKVTQEQVQAALIKVKDSFGKEEAKKLIKDIGGVENMADIKPAKYQAVYDASVARYAELEAAKDAGGDDDGI